MPSKSVKARRAASKAKRAGMTKAELKAHQRSKRGSGKRRKAGLAGSPEEHREAAAESFFDAEMHAKSVVRDLRSGGNRVACLKAYRLVLDANAFHHGGMEHGQDASSVNPEQVQDATEAVKKANKLFQAKCLIKSKSK